MAPSDVALFIDPLTHHFDGDRLFDRSAGARGGDDILGPWIHLRRALQDRGIRVHTADRLVDGAVAPGSANVYVSFGIRDRYRRLAERGDVVLSAFFALECPVVEPRLYAALPRLATSFRRMFSFSTGESLRPYLPEPMTFEQFRLPQSFESVHDVWSRRDRSFLSMINANKVPRLRRDELYGERLRAVEFFARQGEIDLYGVGWDGPAFRVGETRVPAPLRRLGYRLESRWQRLLPGRDEPTVAAARRVWRGAVDSKAAVLSGYTFAICFENMVLEGWVTEKIFDCLLAGTIPIYLGAPDIDRWVAPDCYVDMRGFAGYDELRGYLRSLSPREIDTYREAGRDYLRSEQFRPFTKQAFVEIFEQILSEDAGVSR